MAMRSRTISRWPAHEVASFIELLRELRDFPPPVNAMLWDDDEKMLALEVSEDVSREWERVARHPLWPRLSQDREFNALHESFRTNQRRSRRTVYPRAEFRFLYNVLEGARFFVNWKPKAPAANTRNDALKHIDRLRKARSSGVALSDPGDDVMLTRLLDQLDRELTSVRRKVHEHKKLRESRTIRRVAYALEIDLNGTSGTVLARFAEFAGIDLDHSSIEKILKEARKLNAQYLADLRSTSIPPN